MYFQSGSPRSCISRNGAIRSRPKVRYSPSSRSKPATLRVGAFVFVSAATRFVPVCAPAHMLHPTTMMKVTISPRYHHSNLFFIPRLSPGDNGYNLQSVASLKLPQAKFGRGDRFPIVFHHPTARQQFLRDQEILNRTRQSDLDNLAIRDEG